MLKGKKILLGISGSIAAYKAATLLRLLTKSGAEVKVIMTPAATQFISPLTLSTLSGSNVVTELSEDNTWANHVMLGRWADIMIVAPLSCNTLAKMANGLCDNLLSAIYLSATCPVVVAPAMDEDMWLHQTTKKNIKTIQSFNNYVIPVESGLLASGLTGSGRMAEPETIINWIQKYFEQSKELIGKNILVTAGPTHEPLDPVRFIGNHSSGKMGIAIAEECQRRGANVLLICGPTSQNIYTSIKTIHVTTAAEMYEASIRNFPEMDIAIMSAAVADYSIQNPSQIKIKKSDDTFVVELVKTKDILKSLGKIKKNNQFLVGFALETNDENENAKNKMVSKNADMIVLNKLNDEGAGFRFDTNKITILERNGLEFSFDLKSKKEVAVDIVNTIIKLAYV